MNDDIIPATPLEEDDPIQIGIEETKEETKTSPPKKLYGKITYKIIADMFEDKGCKLLMTEEEFNKEFVDYKGRKDNYKFKIISSCGHESMACRKNFLNQDTGIICAANVKRLI